MRKVGIQRAVTSLFVNFWHGAVVRDYNSVRMSSVHLCQSYKKVAHFCGSQCIIWNSARDDRNSDIKFDGGFDHGPFHGKLK